MLKKISVIFLALIMLFGISACNIKSDDGKGFDKGVTNTESNETPTYYHNTFKDRIPEPDFKETPKERYDDGESYYFTVACTEKEFGNYIKKLKRHGFKNNLVEATGYFYAKDAEEYYTELVYKNGILTATIDR